MADTPLTPAGHRFRNDLRYRDEAGKAVAPLRRALTGDTPEAEA